MKLTEQEKRVVSRFLSGSRSETVWVVAREGGRKSVDSLVRKGLIGVIDEGLAVIPAWRCDVCLSKQHKTENCTAHPTCSECGMVMSLHVKFQNSSGKPALACLK